MNYQDFVQRIQSAERPVVVDFWATWCGPCRAMEPTFDAIRQRYDGRVDVMKINADDSPEVLQALGILGIPTVIAFSGGQEIARRTGMQSLNALDGLFNAAITREKPGLLPLTPLDRTLRAGAGVLLILLGAWKGWMVLPIVFGGLLLLSAFYDRCPLIKALSAKVSGRFKK